MTKWIYLSYPLNSDVFGYGNGDRFKLERVRDICCGDTSNNSQFQMPTHFGTHIDFPFHFDKDGKNASEYDADQFVFNNVGIVEVNENEVSDYLIENSNLDVSSIDSDIELLLVKTSFCDKRTTDEYWQYGLGFHPETADFLKGKFKNLRAIAFDLISLNSYQKREQGRIAHKEYLSKNDVLIIEDLDLRNVSKASEIEQIIVAPLQLDSADGAPVTILAKINE